MKFILDVNVLIAWGWTDHSDFLRVRQWISQTVKEKSTQLITTPITQLGFIRISVHRSSNELSIIEASKILDERVQFLGARHQFISDSIQSLHFPSWCKSANQTTDAHLLKLAESHHAKLATLDEKIPHAFIIPKI
ncbi:MAG: PIN domain-containing protein [Verrucomicrobiota bacterium]